MCAERAGTSQRLPASSKDNESGSPHETPLKVDDPKNLRFISQWTIAKVINPSAVPLIFPATLRRIHPTFRSLLKQAL